MTRLDLKGFSENPKALVGLTCTSLLLPTIVMLFFALWLPFEGEENELMQGKLVLTLLALTGILLIFLLVLHQEGGATVFFAVFIIGTVVTPQGNIETFLDNVPYWPGGKAKEGSERTPAPVTNVPKESNPVKSYTPSVIDVWAGTVTATAEIAALRVVPETDPKPGASAQRTASLRDSLRTGAVEIANGTSSFGKALSQIKETLQPETPDGLTREASTLLSAGLNNTLLQTFAVEVRGQGAEFPLVEISKGSDSTEQLVEDFGGITFFAEDMEFLRSGGYIDFQRGDYRTAILIDKGRQLTDYMEYQTDDSPRLLMESSDSLLADEFSFEGLSDSRSFQLINIEDAVVRSRQSSHVEQHEYRFVVKEIGIYAIEVFGGNDLIMGLYEHQSDLPREINRKPITISDDGSSSLEPKIEEFLEPGIYVVLIRELSGDKLSVEYTISVHKGPLDSEFYTDTFLPDTLPLNKIYSPFKLEVDNEPMSPSPEKPQLFHLYFFKVVKSGDYIVQTFGEIDTEIGLYKLTDRSLVADDDDGGEEMNSWVRIHLDEGEYEVMVVDLDNFFIAPEYTISVVAQ